LGAHCIDLFFRCRGNRPRLGVEFVLRIIQIHLF
jgi:hypothetical protein